MHGAPKFFIGILFPIVFRGMTRGRGASSYEQEKGLLLDLFSFLSVSQSGEEKGSQPPLRANGKYKDFLSSSPFFSIIFPSHFYPEENVCCDFCSFCAFKRAVLENVPDVLFWGDFSQTMREVVTVQVG